MIKHYCDVCEQEITAANQPQRESFGHVYFTASAQTEMDGVRRINIECVPRAEMRFKDNEAPSVEVCRFCIIDAVATADDRPKLEPDFKVTYSDYLRLADAAGFIRGVTPHIDSLIEVVKKHKTAFTV